VYMVNALSCFVMFLEERYDMGGRFVLVIR
jgi:hypothetical protein